MRTALCSVFVQEGGFKHTDGSSALTQELQACAATGWVAAAGAFFFQSFWICISGEIADFWFYFIFLPAIFYSASRAQKISDESDLD